MRPTALPPCALALAWCVCGCAVSMCVCAAFSRVFGQLQRLLHPATEFECCVLSYATPSAQPGAPATVNFQVFDTVLL